MLKARATYVVEQWDVCALADQAFQDWFDLNDRGRPRGSDKYERPGCTLSHLIWFDSCSNGETRTVQLIDEGDLVNRLVHKFTLSKSFSEAWEMVEAVEEEGYEFNTNSLILYKLKQAGLFEYPEGATEIEISISW